MMRMNEEIMERKDEEEIHKNAYVYVDEDNIIIE